MTNRPLAILITVSIPILWIALWLLFVAACCYGCAVGWPATCTDLALTEASVARGQGHEVRIVAGRTAEGGLHATGQAWDDGEWRDLRFWHGDVSIRYGSREISEVIGVWDVGEYAGRRRRFGADLKGE